MTSNATSTEGGTDESDVLSQLQIEEAKLQVFNKVAAAHVAAFETVQQDPLAKDRAKCLINAAELFAKMSGFEKEYNEMNAKAATMANMGSEAFQKLFKELQATEAGMELKDFVKKTGWREVENAVDCQPDGVKKGEMEVDGEGSTTTKSLH